MSFALSSLRVPVRKPLLLLAILLGSLVATPGVVQAQNCALCYTQAAGTAPRMRSALKSGILILIFPPMVICTGLMITAYKRRNRFHQQAVISAKTDLGW